MGNAREARFSQRRRGSLRISCEAMHVDSTEMLKELRIDRSREAEPAGRGVWIAVALAVAALVGAGAWFAFGRMPSYTVRTALAQPLAAQAASTAVLDASGYVTARRQATVSSKVTGRVVEVQIEEGQRVEADQVLARLDATDARAQFDLARAEHDAARAQLADLRVQLAQADRDQRRQEDLVAKKLTSTQAGEDARTRVASLKARLAAQEGQVAVQQRGVEVARVALDNTVVKAPFAGVITVKAAQPGEIVSPMSAGGGYTRTGIGTIVDMDSLEIEVEVNEAYIGRVKAGQPVEAVLNAYPDWKIPAEVIAIIPAADRSKATVKVRIGIKAKDARIVPDMGARVAFLEDRSAPAETRALPGVLVPASAIQSVGDANRVFVFVDGKAQARAVKLGQSFADQRQVLDGVKAGERVVLQPPEGMIDGARLVRDDAK